MTPSDPTAPPQADPAATADAGEPQVGPAADGAADPAVTAAGLPEAGPGSPTPAPEEPTPAEAVAESPAAPGAERTPPPLPAHPPQPVPAVPPAPQPHDLSRMAQDLQVRKAQVEAVVQLLDEENTVPFITRYRKERTGGLNEEVIRRVQERVAALRDLAARKQTILRSVANQGRLNDALTQAILAAESPKRLEDLYQPFKPKKKSLATEARERGLGPLAEAVWNGDEAARDLAAVLPGLVDPDKWLLNTDDVFAGVKHVLAEMVADAADVRGPLRNFTWDTGRVVAVRIETLPEGKGREYEPYFDFKELCKEIPPHRVLAINRGEKANVLRVRVDTDVEMANEIARYHLNLNDHPHRDLLTDVVRDALDRLVLPSLEREVRRELTERAQDHAVHVFARNLRSLLLQPPLRGRKVLAVDPGIRTGCKLAALDETGKLLEDAVVYPHGQKKNQTDARRRMEQLVRKHQISVVAIGNGTGCREAEQLVADLIADLERRRLNPPPPAPAATTESSAAPALAPAADAPPPEAPAPVVPDAPASESIVSAPAPFAAEAHTITSVVTVSAPPVETAGTPPPDAETLTAAPDAAPASETATVAPDASRAGSVSDRSDAPPVAHAHAPGSPAAPRPRRRSAWRAARGPARPRLRDRDRGRGQRLLGQPGRPGGVPGPGRHHPRHRQHRPPTPGPARRVGQDRPAAHRGRAVPARRQAEAPEGVAGGGHRVVRERRRGGPEHRQRPPAAARLRAEPARRPGGRHLPREGRAVHRPGAAARGHGAGGEAVHPGGRVPDDPGRAGPARRHLGPPGELPGRPAGPRRPRVRPRRPPRPGEARRAARQVQRPGRGRAGGPAERRGADRPGHPRRPGPAGPGPREDSPPPIFKTGVLRLEDITPGMELKGTVLNVVPFGAFVDIGLKESGLVHISQMANRYIKSPTTWCRSGTSSPCG